MTRLYGKKPIWITEYGYQTRPPDRTFGVAWKTQAKYLAQAYSIARKNPRVQMMIWFLIKDESRLAGWQWLLHRQGSAQARVLGLQGVEALVLRPVRMVH